MATEAISEHLISKNLLGELPPGPTNLACLRKSDIHVTPLLQILAMGLHCIIPELKLKVVELKMCNTKPVLILNPCLFRQIHLLTHASSHGHTAIKSTAHIAPT